MNELMVVLLLSLVSRWGNWSTERLSHLFKGMQLTSGRARTETPGGGPESMRLATYCGHLRGCLSHSICSVPSILLPKVAGSSEVLSSAFRAISFGGWLLWPPFYKWKRWGKSRHLHKATHSYWQNPGVLLSCRGALLLHSSPTHNDGEQKSEAYSLRIFWLP